jgi:hypothetical protein
MIPQKWIKIYIILKNRVKKRIPHKKLKKIVSHHKKKLKKWNKQVNYQQNLVAKQI